jgi:thiol:disulfide interchange protein
MTFGRRESILDVVAGSHLYGTRALMRLRFSILSLLVFVSLAAVATHFSLIAYRAWLAPRRPIPWVVFTPTAVDEARSNGQMVLLHFKADWDMSTVLLQWDMDVPSVRWAIHRYGVVPILADVSDESPDRDYLKQVSQNGAIPLTIVYPRQKDLPPISLEGYIRNDALIRAIEQAHAGSGASTATAAAGSSGTGSR